MPEVVTLGETMVSLRADGLVRLGTSFRSSIAGAESNVAIGLSRLGHHVRWLGRVGDDEPGDLVLRTLRAEGVDVSTVEHEEAAPTGLILFEQRLPGVTRVRYYRAGSAGSRLRADDVALGDDVRLVHLTGITPALGDGPREAVEAALAQARERGATVSFDVNHRAKLWAEEQASSVLTPLAHAVDVVIGSTDELDLVGGTQALLDAGVREVVTKLGADGASVTTADGELHAPGHRVPVVDSVGAGDAFTAGYLSALRDGLDPAARLDRGNRAGAFAVATSGDWEGLPTRSELGLLALEEGAALR
ncbi:sugar kinase [Saccharomonospora cyanea]|uniref:Sugar kinase, ribokinase n=1 Tax=Saccharomonospora cyanea NA-134 TaxID=882082 RepID=H5XGM6_9PSEU|nr:sugar kinase [Saccharomonospora cyanea]EHR60565.1 sugar kinase, ribokinase [Saccharomonospora cyanea NA-134]